MLSLRAMLLSTLICHLRYATVADDKGLGGKQGAEGS